MEPIVGKRRIFMSIRIWCFSWVCWNKAWSRRQDRSPIAIKTFTTQKRGKLKTWPNWKQFRTLFGEIDGLSYMLIFGNNYEELASLQTSHGIKKIILLKFGSTFLKNSMSNGFNFLNGSATHHKNSFAYKKCIINRRTKKKLLVSNRTLQHGKTFASISLA